jgi:phage-related protein
MVKYFNVEYLFEAVYFIESQEVEVQNKIYYNITKAQHTRDPELFKKLAGSEIWEFRTLYKGKKYRLFSFWDSKRRAYVICTHGIIKKTDKTPQKEIEKAEQIRKQYLANYGK